MEVLAGQPGGLHPVEVLCKRGGSLSTQLGPDVEDMSTGLWKIPTTGRDRYSPASGGFAKLPLP